MYWNQATCCLFLPHIKLFEKIKRGLGLASLSHFLYNFWKKIFLSLYYINYPNFIACFSLFCKILSSMSNPVVCWPVFDVMNFEMNFIFLTKPFLLHDKKVKTKSEISWGRNKLLRWKGLSMNQITQHFLEGESSILRLLTESQDLE